VEERHLPKRDKRGMRKLLLLLSLSAVAQGCAHQSLKEPEMAAMLFEATPPSPAVLTENHFSRDKASAISEADLKTILASPVFIEENARIGVLPVQTRYEVDAEVPLTAVPAELTDSLEQSGMFELASEVSTDFPIDSGTAGLRELAARYRTEYLLFYRHRFTEQSYANAAAWGYLTVVGAFFLPGTQLEARGVLEATLFDAKTGTILFTVYERVHGDRASNVWHTDEKMDDLKKKLLEDAQKKLSAQVVAKCRRLVASRPELNAEEPKAEASVAPQG
jgi:hypothetical protein